MSFLCSVMCCMLSVLCCQWFVEKFLRITLLYWKCVAYSLHILPWIYTVMFWNEMEISITFMRVCLAFTLCIWEVTACRPHILNEDSVYFPSAVYENRILCENRQWPLPFIHFPFYPMSQSIIWFMTTCAVKDNC